MKHSDDQAKEDQAKDDPAEASRAEASRAEDNQPAKLKQYADLLATVGVERGFIGPREVERLWDRHIINCLNLGELIAADDSVADIGSGAGLPGIVLAITRPTSAVTLIEPLGKRANFLIEVADRLGLANVEVIRGRAEEVSDSYSVVTSRAVAPLPKLLDWSLPLVAASGCVLAIKGARAQEEFAAAKPVLTKFRCKSPELLTLGQGESQTTVVRVCFVDPSQVGLGFLGGKKGKMRGRARGSR